jgi:DNA-binding PadR family transcriptional regulator
MKKVALLNGLNKMIGKKKGVSKDAALSELTTADLLVLSLLSERPMHGYELLREFDQQEVTEWARVSRPHVYYALQKLARLGFTEPIPEKAVLVSTRGRTTYRVSALGKAALRKELGRASWAQATSPAPFSTWFGLSIHASPSQRRKMLVDRTAFLTAEIARKHETLKFIEGYDSARAPTGIQLVRLYIEQCSTELRWIESIQAEQ